MTYNAMERKKISEYLNNLDDRRSAYFKGKLIKAICLGKNVLPILDDEFTTAQKTEILIGIMNDVEYTIYANKSYSPQKMHEIRLCLEYGIKNIPIYATYNSIRAFKDTQRKKILKKIIY